MPTADADRREARMLIAIFIVALGYSFYGITYHFTMGFMSGHEFRQAQTAIVSYYIDQQNNFSLLYETPIMGKPWVSILLEVPIYEWSVVGLSRLTGLPQVVAARCISAASFYLMLPAVYLLLGRLRLPRPRRLLMLALILTTPVYIYYSRAFLMDAMALMCSVWFLLGFVRTMDERRWSWLALTIVAGTAAALIKSAIWAIWILPAAAYGAWLLWQDLRAKKGWVVPVKTLLWGLATVVVALGALRAWVAYTDPIKAAHPSAFIFSSKNLTEGNWGLFDLKALLSRDLWRTLIGCWEQAIMSRWLIGLGLVVGLASPVRWRVLGIGSVFFFAQFLFPFAYAYQDYYFYANAAFVVVALGFTVLGLLDTPSYRWCGWLALALVMGSQVRTYWQDYRQGQSVIHHGGYPFTDAIRDLTPKNSVIVVAGADWAAMTPLYAQRKALMIRNGLEYDEAYLQRAFNDLADEDVSAIVLFGGLRTNRHFIELLAKRFDFDPAAPTFSWTTADVYVPRIYRMAIQIRLKDSTRYQGITLPPQAAAQLAGSNRIKISAATAGNAFPNIKPGPVEYQFQFGIDWMAYGNISVLSSHPNTDLWLPPPANAREIKWDYGIFAGAYEREGDKTDGVEFIILGEFPDGTNRPIYTRLLDPVRNPADRGDQHVVIPYKPEPGEMLRFSTRPNVGTAFDWAYTIGIEVK
jgi:hypothetical protein